MISRASCGRKMKTGTLFLVTGVLGCWATFMGGCLSFSAADSVCPDCEGQAKRSLCGICWGKGLRVEKQQVTYERCPTCLGTGQNQTMFRPSLNETLARFASICPSCSGRGEKKVVTPLLVHCEGCRGTGNGPTQVFCGRCQGSGQRRGIFRRGKNRKGWIPVPSAILFPEAR
jgi:DnaJ-class molecular chaperone